jgi:Ca2+-binding RTX toxin-like protein
VQADSPNSNSPTATVSETISVHLATAPAFNSKTGLVTITMSDETAEVYLSAADSSVYVNGIQAVDSTVTPSVTAVGAGTKANVKAVHIVDTAGTTGDVVILNYGNGYFGQGSTTAAGTTVTLPANSNSLVIKGTTGVDNIAFGANGISLTNGAKTPTKDIVATNVGTYNVFLDDGDDIFTSSGNTAIGAAFTAGVSIFGGGGNDTLVEGPLTTPSETFSGGAGTDTVDYSARPANKPVMVTMDMSGTTKSGQATTPGTQNTVTEDDYILDVDVIKGTPGNDWMAGDIQGTSVTLSGGLGNDTYGEGTGSATTYGSGSETLVGGGGTDVVDYSLRTASLTVTMDGKTASGDPTLNSNAGEADIIGADVNNIKLGSGGGTYTGNTLDNTFTSNTAGVSTIYGLDGNDTLVEGANTNHNGSETFNGGTGNDTMDYSARVHAIICTMDGETACGDVTGNTNAGENDYVGTDVENLYGGSGADTLTGNDGDNDIEGNGGGDTLCGGLGNDTLLGFPHEGNSSAAAHLHGSDCADSIPDPGYNICLDTGTHQNSMSVNDFTPTVEGDNVAGSYCELVTN